jgi:histidyl-tRNA synthetase
VAQQIQAIRGMNDVLPAHIAAWQHLEACAREVASSYGYEEIRVPLLEHTELFRRAIGEFTDVVEKEMYTFTDQGGESLTLRPEATAGIVRAAISNGLLRGARHRLWCIGPMFRHERPQKGRYRQFYQLDVEAIGFAGPDVDAELIALSARLWRRLELSGVRLEINSLGTPEARREYREILVAYFRRHESALDADSRRRLQGNPLRILDSKNPQMAEVIAGAPLLSDHLDEPSRAHFAALTAALDGIGIAYRVNPRLVRGLDYYSRTVFEWITDALGAQDAVCSGGRYDGLIAQLGGEATPAVLVQAARVPAAVPPDVYVIVNGSADGGAAIQMTEELRDALPHRRFEFNLGGGNFKAQFRRADKSGAALALICGDEEMGRGVVAMKPLRHETGQTECPRAELASKVEELLVRLTSRTGGG